MRCAPIIVLAVPALFLLPGCIAWEIRDEMRLANANLACANAGIEGANQRIDKTNQEVDGANARMDAVTVRLDLATERMAQTHENIIALRSVLLETNQRLTAVESQLIKTEPMVGTANSRLEDLMVLRDVHRSLVNIEATLGPLSRSMSSVGGVVSLLGLGGDAEPAAPAAAPPAVADAGGAGAAPTGSKDAATSKDASAAAPARNTNLLVGTWVLAYPAPDSATRQAPDQALVILAGGKYLLAVHGKPLVTGDWTQKDKTLTLTPSPPPPPVPPAPPAGSGAPAALNPPAPPAPQAVTMEVLNNTLRALSVRIGDQVWVYTRP